MQSLCSTRKSAHEIKLGLIEIQALLEALDYRLEWLRFLELAIALFFWILVVQAIDVVYLEDKRSIHTHEEGSQKEAAVVKATHIPQQVPVCVSLTTFDLKHAIHRDFYFEAENIFLRFFHRSVNSR